VCEGEEDNEYARERRCNEERKREREREREKEVSYLC
jgi:hypothetical protein